MTGEPSNGRVTPRELATLRDEHGRRIGHVEMKVDEHEATFQQMRGAKVLLILIFGSSLATLILMAAALLR